MSRSSSSRSWRRLTMIMLAVAMTVTACAQSEEGVETFFAIGNESEVFGGEPYPAVTAAAAAPALASDGGEQPRAASVNDLGTGGIGPTVLQTQNFGRDIIFTADMVVAVNDVATAGEEATRLVQSLGGFLFGQRTVGSPEPTSVLTFKVQPEEFQEALSRLGSIGEIRTQNVSAHDVTERVVDLESRINTATASVERLGSLISQAPEIKAIIELENELLVRETQLETLRGQLRTLEDQVALATIVLTLTEAATRPAIELVVTAYPTHDDGLSCPGNHELGVEEEARATVCFEIINVGDTWLSGFELRDPVLDVEINDLVVVFGDPSRAMEPGQSIVLATEFVAERNLRTQTTVTAEPVNEDGVPLPGRPAAATVAIYIEVVDAGGIATFGEGLQASWELLVGLGQVVVLLAGALIPFFWVPLVFWLLWRMRRTRLVGPSSGPAPEGHGGAEED